MCPNSIAEEIDSYYGVSEDASLAHYGMPRRSGRYPWGSGDDPYQRSIDFLGRVEELKKTGWTETPENIKSAFNMTTTQYRAEKGLAKDTRRMYDVARAKSLKSDGYGDTEIGRIMGVNESTVRSWLNKDSESRMNQAKETADFLRTQLTKKKMIDVGTGVERELNISKEKLDQAIAILENEGCVVYKGGIPQATNPGKQTNQKVLCVPGTEHKEIYNFENVHSVQEYISRDGGATFEKKFHYPESMSSKRLQIKYAEEGGIEKDGIVELRRGVKDLSLGDSRYAQVRILVDGTHYIKGMAVYADDLPDGVDVRFNTNKKVGTPTKDVLKKIKDDPDNPFGSAIKDADQGGQYWYDPKTGKRVSSSDPNAKLGLINKRADEGDWSDWKDALPSQFLSKQPLPMAKKQLKLAIDDKMAEYDEICALPNPTLKKHLLEKFADTCDAAAVDLQAAALPGQKYHVIIPVPSLKDTEVYAPGYEPGTKLALVRYPHGGIFEIPILNVTNRNKVAKELIGTDPIDAICINSKVAERLSGADFDGDTVMCIPTHDRAGKVKIKNADPLEGLKDFDPKTKYATEKVVGEDGVERLYRDGREVKRMKNTGTQMGIISNLITDMTLQGATDDEKAAAVRHSMVVIDAEKHKLDYKQSELDNNIAALKKKYQRYVDDDGTVRSGGASTLISRSKGEVSVLKRQGSPKINQKGKAWYDPNKPEGSLVYDVADDVEYQVKKTNKRTGEVTVTTQYRKQQSTRMAETDDAFSLVSEADTAMERAYAEYANKMKSMANQARMEMVHTGKIAYSKNAKAVYQKEVKSLEDKLRTAELNAPRERQAQRLANVEVENKVKAVMDANPGMTKKEAKRKVDVKKTGQQALTKFRQEVSSVARRDRSIHITDKEWEAIQAGAISENQLKKILKNTDVDRLRELATPRAKTTLRASQITRIKSLSNSNYTIGEIAKKLGVSTTVVSNCLKGVN